MVYSSYKQQRILYHSRLSKRSYTISRLLKNEGLTASRSGVAKFLKKYEKTGSIARQPGSGRPTKITPEVLQIVENQMQFDDETTATQLQKILYYIMPNS